jgi:hypothetical protein
MPVDATSVVSQIHQGAVARNLDPSAVLAVAGQEGLSGKPGDNNTSFGPFQLHISGALPQEIAAKGPTFAQAWAMSPAGINYALDAIAKVAGGLRGPQAVQAIVSRFERPANVAGEVSRATGGLGSVPTVSAPVPLPGSPVAQVPSQAPPNPQLAAAMMALQHDPVGIRYPAPKPARRGKPEVWIVKPGADHLDLLAGLSKPGTTHLVAPNSAAGHATMAAFAHHLVNNPKGVKRMIYTGPGRPRGHVSNGKVRPYSMLTPGQYVRHATHVKVTL